MEHYSPDLDGIFQALADPTRRAVIGRLGQGPASIGELAKPFAITLPSFMKHIHALESSGWITTRKHGRVRTCAIHRPALDAANTWLAQQQAFWEQRFDRFDTLLEKDDAWKDDD